MAHYICTGGCNGIAETPGACQAHSCIRANQPLTICNCTDGLHKEAYENDGVVRPKEDSTN